MGKGCTFFILIHIAKLPVGMMVLLYISLSMYKKVLFPHTVTNTIFSECLVYALLHYSFFYATILGACGGPESILGGSGIKPQKLNFLPSRAIIF